MLLPEYRALRRFVTGTASDGAPTRFAARLVALGPVFVKLGQILSTRPDVMPQAYVDALSRLQENGPEVPSEAIRATIESQLGKPVEELFATFEQKPVAAASFAQVHRATLPDGTVVAVKVQRPDLERLVCRDLDAMEAGLGWLYRLFPRRRADESTRVYRGVPALHAPGAGLLAGRAGHRPLTRQFSGPRRRQVSHGLLEPYEPTSADHELGGWAAPP